jgi:ribokinase
MPSHDVVVVGGANMDYLVRAPRLPRPGETVGGDLFQEAPGGKGMNQAVAAARLGARTALVARLGADDRAAAILERLRAEGVDDRFVGRDPALPTGTALIAVDARGEKQIVFAPGANGQLSPEAVEAAAPLLSATAVLLLQLEIPLASVVAAARLARQAGARVVLDPAPPTSLPEALFPLLDVIRPNSSEAEALTGVPVRDRESAREAAARLLARGVGAVAVQAGGDGNLLVWPEGERWLPRIPVEAVDATGAGDAFAAAFAVSLARGCTLAEAGAFASAAAALATTKVGAQAGLPRRDEVERLLRDGP